MQYLVAGEDEYMSNRNYSLNVFKKQGNVRVRQVSERDGLYTIVSLHGNDVFTINTTKQIISFSTCGWYTSSTRDVINTALRAVRPDMRIFKSKNIWRCSFANGEEEAHLEACENKFYSIK